MKKQGNQNNNKDLISLQMNKKVYLENNGQECWTSTQKIDKWLVNNPVSNKENAN